LFGFDITADRAKPARVDKSHSIDIADCIHSSDSPGNVTSSTCRTQSRNGSPILVGLSRTSPIYILLSIPRVLPLFDYHTTIVLLLYLSSFSGKIAHLSLTLLLLRTMAQAFSLALDSAFMLDNEVDTLSQSIEQK
jgi:hypothetical protein